MNKLSSLLTFIGSFEPVGSVKMYAGSSEPDKWLFCRGQAVSRTTYAKLFAVIGTTYGAGDGSTTFNVPDLRDRMPIGVGNLYALNAKGGSKDSVVPYHRHSVSAFNTGGMSGNTTHTHPITDGFHWKAHSSSDVIDDNVCLVNPYTSGTYFFHSKHVTGNNTSIAHTHQVGAHNTNYEGTSGNATNANLPPYRGLNFIIFAGK